MHFKYKQTIGMVFGDDEGTRLISSGEAQPYNCLPLPLKLKVAGEEQSLDLIENMYMQREYKRTIEKGCLPVFNIVVYYKYGEKL